MALGKETSKTYARRQPAQPVPLSMIAPVGQTSAARRADFRSASAIGRSNGPATVTWNPRPMKDKPKFLARLGRHLHAGAADDALARLEDDLRVGGVPREVAPLADEALRVHAVFGRKLAQPAGDRLAAAAAQAAPGFPRRGLRREAQAPLPRRWSAASPSADAAWARAGACSMPRRKTASSSSLSLPRTTFTDSGAPMTFFPLRYWSMDAAASLPAATARTARSGPVTASPPAKTPGRFVASVFGSAAMPHFERVSCALLSGCKSTLWPMAAMTQVACTSKCESGIGTGRARPLASGAPNSIRWQVRIKLPVLALQPHRGDEELDLDALGLCRFDFLHEARHLAAGAAVEHAHGLGAQPHRAAAGVHGRVAAADDDDVAPHGGRRAVGELFEKLQRGRGQLFAGAAQAARALGADGEEHGVEVPPQIVEREVAAQPFAQAELGAQVADHFDLRIQHLPRQAKRRDAIAQHPARLRVRVKQHRAMAAPEQMMRRSQPRRPGADDGDALGAVQASGVRSPGPLRLGQTPSGQARRLRHDAPVLRRRRSDAGCGSRAPPSRRIAGSAPRTAAGKRAPARPAG